MNKIITLMIAFLLLSGVCYGQLQIVSVSFQELGSVNTWADSQPERGTAVMIRVMINENLNLNALLDREYYNNDGSLRRGNSQDPNTNNIQDIGNIINRDSTSQIRVDTVSAVQAKVDALNLRYNELIAILQEIENTRALINTYLAETVSGDHMDKPHPKHMDTLAYWKHRREEKESQISYAKDEARTESGQGTLGWFVSPPSSN